MDRGIATVNVQDCMSCGVCVQACPFSYLELSKISVDALRKTYPQLVAGHRCTGCGLCVTACPVDSISIRVSGG
jgi:formate hydrogenlyase subunit 6/NADH:ubiquinone oxidoreductase subunit I